MTMDSLDPYNREVPPEQIPSCVRFCRKSADDRLLTVTVDPNTDFPDGIPIDQLKEWINSLGCHDWFLHEEAIRRCGREARHLESPRQYTVAEKRDCRIVVEVSSDRLRAWVRVSPAFGGESLTETAFREALNGSEVRFGIHEELVREILEKGECERTLIAEGVSPVTGEPAVFERLVLESNHKGAPQEREDGTVDYKDLGLFVSVAVGTPLLRHIPAGPGKPGTGVDGSLLPAMPGSDRPLRAGPGTRLSADDPDVVVAARVGQPSFDDNWVRVDPTIEVDGVNPSTGNLIFEGNVIVRGAVEPGFTVKAGHDLMILDTVEGANLSAGRNIVLLTGVYGRNQSEIIAKGNIEARFLSDCTVQCEGNIEVNDLIAHCDIECEGSVLAGASGGKGWIMGGRVRAKREVHARILGSVSESATMIEVAAAGQGLKAQKAATDEAVNQTRIQIDTIERMLQVEDVTEAFEERYAFFCAQLEEQIREQKEIEKRLADLNAACIRAEQVHHGVTLRIGDTLRTFTETTADVLLRPVAAQTGKDKKEKHRDAI